MGMMMAVSFQRSGRLYYLDPGPYQPTVGTKVLKGSTDGDGIVKQFIPNDAKSAKGGGSRQFNGLVDVYKKTLASDGLAGLYRGFVPSVVGIIVYRGLYFGVYDSLSAFVFCLFRFNCA